MILQRIGLNSRMMFCGDTDQVDLKKNGESGLGFLRKIKNIKGLHTIELLERQDQLRPLYPHKWPANSPDLNPVDFCIWGELEQRVFKGRLITTMEELKKAIRVEWKAFPQQIVAQKSQDHRNQSMPKWNQCQ